MKITAYITKYSLTDKKIRKVDGELSSSSDSCLIVRKPGLLLLTEYYHVEGREWHRTAESAIARAESMRVRKIQSLQKQINKLSQMTFKCE